jgi:hypothetical protein
LVSGDGQMKEIRLSVFLFIVGLFICMCHLCGPARADATDRALSKICPHAQYLADVVRDVAKRNLIHPAVLVAQMKAESNCQPDRINKRTKAAGLMQILYEGSANPGRAYTRLQLLSPWINLTLGARHLNRYLLLCRKLGAAIHIYHGHKKCSGWRHDLHVLRVLQFYQSVFENGRLRPRGWS